MCRVSTQITGNSASARALQSHCDSGPASCALKALLRRWPKLALAVPEQEIRWRPRTGFRAIERLPVAVA
jgi:hypothetical protein